MPFNINNLLAFPQSSLKQQISIFESIPFTLYLLDRLIVTLKILFINQFIWSFLNQQIKDFLSPNFAQLLMRLQRMWLWRFRIVLLKPFEYLILIRVDYLLQRVNLILKNRHCLWFLFEIVVLLLHLLVLLVSIVALVLLLIAFLVISWRLLLRAGNCKILLLKNALTIQNVYLS